MKRVSKRDAILNAIIKEYLKYKEPIGSSELQARMEIELSPSTIRIYLKELSEIGALVQLHVSSGRIPTYEALMRYWQKRLEPQEKLEITNLENLEESVLDFGLFCIAEKVEKNPLKALHVVNDKFLVLEFVHDEVVLKHTKQIERFLSNLVGCEIRELKSISAQVGLYELHDKLDQIFSHSHLMRSGEKEVYEIAREIENSSVVKMLLDSEFSFNLKYGIYFDGFVPSGCMGLKHAAKIGNDEADIFCFGKLESDFEGFLNQIRSDIE